MKNCSKWFIKTRSPFRRYYFREFTVKSSLDFSKNAKIEISPPEGVFCFRGGVPCVVGVRDHRSAAGAKYIWNKSFTKLQCLVSGASRQFLNFPWNCGALFFFKKFEKGHLFWRMPSSRGTPSSSAPSRRQIMQPWPLCLVNFGKSKVKKVRKCAGFFFCLLLFCFRLFWAHAFTRLPRASRSFCVEFLFFLTYIYRFGASVSAAIWV